MKHPSTYVLFHKLNTLADIAAAGSCA